MDKIEEDMQLRNKLKLQSMHSQNSTHNSTHLAQPEDEEGNTAEEFGTGALARTHNLWPEVKKRKKLNEYCFRILINMFAD